MYFLNKKRHQRDQEAGLIFRWRGAKKHHAGKIVALLITLGFFAFAIFTIRIDGGQEPTVSKRSGSVFMINEDDPNSYQLLVQIEERSPFPHRWDPAYDVGTMTRVSRKADQLAGPISLYKPNIEELPAKENDLSLPSIIQPDSLLIGKSLKTWMLAEQTASLPRGDVYVRAYFTGYEVIAERLRRGSLTLPSAMIAEEWYGQTFRFLISIDEKGIVGDCLSLSLESLEAFKPTEKEKLMANWLRNQRFAADKGSSEVRGVVELEIEALEE